MKDFQSLYAELYTPDLEPPHAFLLKVKIDNGKKGIKVSIEQSFYGRENLSEEELKEEGYSGQDDFKWDGMLPESWTKEFFRLVSNTKLDAEEEDVYLKVDKVSGYPDKPERWRYILQELLQASLETSGKEAPFEAALIKNTKDHSEKTFITASFFFRKATVQKEKDSKSANKETDWAVVRPLLAAIHNLDLHEEGLSESGHEGIFLNPGDGFWYKLPESLRRPEKSQKKIEKLEKIFNDL